MRFSQRDIIRGFILIPSTQNRYAYCLNNPILFTDPSGEFVLAALLIGAAIGAIIGGVSSYKAQKAATGKVDAWKVAKDALIGGVVGGVVGVVGAAVAGALATAVGATTLTATGLTTTLTLAQSVGVMSVSAVAAGTVARATNAAVRNSFTNEPKRDVAKEAFNPKAMTTDAVVGGISGVATYYSTGGVYSTTSIDRRYGGSTTPTSTKPTQGDKPNGSTSGDNPLDDAVRNASGEYAGEQYGGATQGERAGSTVCTETGSTSTTRVGRWMSIDEYKAMQSTGKVQMSPEGNTTYVANPADPNAFRGAPTGSVYVEFDVPTSSVKAAGNSMWGQIPGPGSNLDKYDQILKGAQPIIEMPDAMNIQLIGGK